MLLWGFGALAGATVLALGAWIYVVQNVELPEYRVISRDAAIEIRDYPPMVVAEVTREGERWLAVNAGFRPLARYIFAKDRDGASVAMTAPVTQSRIAEGRDAWAVRFIMPAKYALDTLPRPGSPDVSLRSVPAQRLAAIRFSGVATDALVAAKEQRLRDWLAAQGLAPKGLPTYAYYNDPMTPGALRRNEVLIEVPVAPGAAAQAASTASGGT